MAVHAGYEAATRCTGGPTPGARELMAWFLGAFGARGGKNLGIYNCRTVRGGDTTSLHGEGRACDFGINPHSAAYGDELAELLRLHSAELGIQCVIWNRRIWSGAKPDVGWRPYTGTNPHVDHLHVELTRAAAASLTAARVAQILTTEDEMSQAQVDQIRRDIEFMRDQILTELGADPATAPGARPPAERAGIAKARRVDVGYAHQELTNRLGELGAKLDDLIDRQPVAGDDTTLAAVGRAIDDLTRRVLALEARMPTGGTS